LDPSKKDPPPRVMYTSLFLWTTNYKRILLVGPMSNSGKAVPSVNEAVNYN